MKRPQTSINTGLAAIFTLFYLQKSSFMLLQMELKEKTFPYIFHIFCKNLLKSYFHVMILSLMMIIARTYLKDI